MASKLFILIFALTILGCNQPEKKLDQECILMQPQYTTVSCGVLSVWIGMKFKNLRNNQQFVGLIQCPELFDSVFFQKGKKYSIRYNSEIPDSSKNLIVNAFIKDSIPLYKVEEIKAIQ